MDEIGTIFRAWPVLLIGVLVYLIMYAFTKAGELLWKVKKLRKTLKVLGAVAPWLPWAFGGGLGAIPIWPRPGLVLELPDNLQVWAMVLLGIVAGALYERIWKSVKQVLEAQGIDVDLDMPPKEQTRLKEALK